MKANLEVSLTAHIGLDDNHPTQIWLSTMTTMPDGYPPEGLRMQFFKNGDIVPIQDSMLICSEDGFYMHIKAMDSVTFSDKKELESFLQELEAEGWIHYFVDPK